MRVWRVAHETARDPEGFPSGPYTGHGLPSRQFEMLWLMGSDHSDDWHLPPAKDPLLRDINSSERCGFEWPEVAYEWFAGWLRRLDQCGFLLWEYECPDEYVRVGMNGQLVFKARMAKQVRTVRLWRPTHVSSEQGDA